MVLWITAGAPSQGATVPQVQPSDATAQGPTAAPLHLNPSVMCGTPSLMRTLTNCRPARARNQGCQGSQGPQLAGNEIRSSNDTDDEQLCSAYCMPGSMGGPEASALAEAL